MASLLATPPAAILRHAFRELAVLDSDHDCWLCGDSAMYLEDKLDCMLCDRPTCASHYIINGPPDENKQWWRRFTWNTLEKIGSHDENHLFFVCARCHSWLFDGIKHVGANYAFYLGDGSAKFTIPPRVDQMFSFGPHNRGANDHIAILNLVVDYGTWSTHTQPGGHVVACIKTAWAHASEEMFWHKSIVYNVEELTPEHSDKRLRQAQDSLQTWLGQTYQGYDKSGRIVFVIQTHSDDEGQLQLHHFDPKNADNEKKYDYRVFAPLKLFLDILLPFTVPATFRASLVLITCNGLSLQMEKNGFSDLKDFAARVRLEDMFYFHSPGLQPTRMSTFLQGAAELLWTRSRPSSESIRHSLKKLASATRIGQHADWAVLEFQFAEISKKKRKKAAFFEELADLQAEENADAHGDDEDAGGGDETVGKHVGFNSEHAMNIDPNPAEQGELKLVSAQRYHWRHPVYQPYGAKLPVNCPVCYSAGTLVGVEQARTVSCRRRGCTFKEQLLQLEGWFKLQGDWIEMDMLLAYYAGKWRGEDPFRFPLGKYPYPPTA